MASKTLIRTGASLMNRFFLSNPILHQNPNPNSQLLSRGFEITPRLFPSLSKFQTSLHLTQNDAHSFNKLSNEEFFHPCGLPSLRFFLPDGTLSLSHIRTYAYTFRRKAHCFSFLLLDCTWLAPNWMRNWAFDLTTVNFFCMSRCLSEWCFCLTV